jgi:hypothetical protein
MSRRIYTYENVYRPGKVESREPVCATGEVALQKHDNITDNLNTN